MGKTRKDKIKSLGLVVSKKLSRDENQGKDLRTRVKPTTQKEKGGARSWRDHMYAIENDIFDDVDDVDLVRYVFDKEL